MSDESELPVTHICTTNSLSAGVDIPPRDCPLCKNKTLIATWVDSECMTCGFNTEQYYGRNLMTVRERMGMSRKQFSKLIGYKPSTIKKYEWTNPSEKYANLCQIIIQEHFNTESQ